MACFRDLIVYRKAFELSMLVYHLSKRFPTEERYSLTDQCRRSSRSVGAQIAEAYRRRKYPAHFVAKLTDADAENCETQSWMDQAMGCGYLTSQDVQPIEDLSQEVGNLLGSMMRDHEKWCLPPWKFPAKTKIQ
ncbi:MAG: four helix bundle protein [Flavobacteriales bacterium]|nr:four helix bundle protein [Flavobacteriales bacterium]